jgi:hypothetical protein
MRLAAAPAGKLAMIHQLSLTLTTTLRLFGERNAVSRSARCV